MKLPKFSKVITIPVLFVLNFLAWIYVYDDYMMSWVIIYPIFMLVALAFTISAEVAFGRERKVKYIGINVCLVLLFLILAQKYLPMENIEKGLVENYYSHIKADVDLSSQDKAVRANGVTLTLRDYQENSDGKNKIKNIEIFKEKELIESITLERTVKKVEELMPPFERADFNNIFFNDVRYVGVKKKGGEVSLVFQKGHVFFKYDLKVNEQGFIWEQDNYKFAGLEMPDQKGREQASLYDDETNKKIKKFLLKGDPKQLVEVEVGITGNKQNAKEGLENLGYQVLTLNPLMVKIPFYEIANLAHEEYVNYFSIK